MRFMTLSFPCFMQFKFKLLRYKVCTLIFASAVALTACSTTPDPSKICTAEWIEPRADKALGRIETRLDETFKSLRKAGDAWTRGQSPGLFTMMSLDRSLKDLERELTDGRGIRDLRLLAETCDDPDFIQSELNRLLDRQNVPPAVINFMNQIGLYQRLLDLAEGRNPNSSS